MNFDKIFEFAVTIALRTAVGQAAYGGKDIEKPTKENLNLAPIKAFVDKVIRGAYKSQGEYDKDFLLLLQAIKMHIQTHYETEENGFVNGLEIKKWKMGNSQKLVNITLKYMYIAVYYEHKWRENFKFCHCPMDKVLLKNVWDNFNKPKPFSKTEPWSQEEFDVRNYAQSRYCKFQECVRELATQREIYPLEYDYIIW